MSNWWWILIAAIGALAIFWFVRRIQNKRKNTLRGVEVASKYKTKTPLGIMFVTDTPPTPTELTEVDGGLLRAHADAEASGYTNLFAPSQVTVYTPKAGCTPSPIQGVPSFLVYAPNYRGHPVFDPDGDGYILAAERVIELHPNPKLIVCRGVLKDGARYGMEHCLINFNDYEYMQATQTHTAGGHPLLPHLTSKTLENRPFLSADIINPAE